MVQPYVGEIRMFAGSFEPNGWYFCDGRLLPISEFATLVAVIGTSYGGDGESTFALPDMRGRIPIHQGGGFALAQSGGAESVTLTESQIPSHTHQMLASSDPAGARVVTNAVFGRGVADTYASEFTGQALSSQSVDVTGGSQPHSNFQPYLCINHIISLSGQFPAT